MCIRDRINGEEAVRRMNAACVEGIEVVSFRQIAEEKKMTGMTILSAAEYLTTVSKGTFPPDWKEQLNRFYEQPQDVYKRQEQYKKEFGCQSQLLHAYQLIMPECKGELRHLSGMKITAPLPSLFEKVLRAKGVNTDGDMEFKRP